MNRATSNWKAGPGKVSPLVKAITAHPTGADGMPVRHNVFKSAFELLVLDMKRAKYMTDARKQLDGYLVQLDTMRKNGRITSVQYHEGCVVWHRTLIELLKRGA